MNAVKTFQSPDIPLHELLSDIRKAKIQLPDFQRGWVWDDEHITSLLASISLSYPIGAIMLLETGGDGAHFKPRLFEGVSLPDPPAPDLLILDGQQRLTSLFLAISAGQPVPTKDAKNIPVKRWYYADIAQTLNENADREEAIFSIREDRVVKTIGGEIVRDLSSREKEYEQLVFPLARVFDLDEWKEGYDEHWDYDKDKLRLFTRFNNEVIKRFEQYQVPGIQLVKETPKEAVCQVFEKVNTGGVSLTVFELLTATYAAENFSLRDDWEERRKALVQERLLRNIESTDFLQAITLLGTYRRHLEAVGAGDDSPPAISCKRKDVLRLKLVDYQYWKEAVAVAYVRVARILYAEKVYDFRDLPYRTQLVPFAAIVAELGKEAENAAVKDRLRRWYWCGVLGELYGSAVESRFARDLPQTLRWIRGGPEPDTVSEANFAPARLRTLRSRQSAAYKGLFSLIMRDGGSDFRTGESIDLQKYFDDAIDIHHVFPRAWCQKRDIDWRVYDSIINKTPLAARTNRTIGGRAPSENLQTIQKNDGPKEDVLNAILTSHLLDASSMRADDFDGFFTAREQALLERIEQVMGKTVLEDKSLPEGSYAAADGDEEMENVVD